MFITLWITLKKDTQKNIKKGEEENKNINESMIELIDKMIELGVGAKKNDGDEQEGQKLDKAKTIKKTKKDNCCARKKSG